MRSQDVLALLDYEAKRLPALADLIARIDDLTETEIEHTPVKMAWMRQALLKLKRQKRNALLAAVVADSVIDSQTDDPEGEMRQWQGTAAFVRIGRTEIEISHGQLVWFGQGGVWIDSIYTKLIDPRLHTQTVSRGRTSRSGYLQAVRERLLGMNPTPVAQAEPEIMSGVRFYRPANTG